MAEFPLTFPATFGGIVTVIDVNKLAAIDVRPAPLTPANDFYGAVDWTTDSTPRWQGSGALFRPTNYGFQQLFGVWAPDWNATLADLDPDDDVKVGVLRDYDATPFTAMTIWAADKNTCGDLTVAARDEAKDRVLHSFGLHEQNELQRDLVSRLSGDAATATSTTATGAAATIGELDALIASTGARAFVHVDPTFLATLVGAQVLHRDGGQWLTPMDNPIVTGGGYVGQLDNQLLAVSQLYGWRTEVVVNEHIDYETNTYIVIAERSVIIGYEQAIGLVEMN